MSMGFEHRNLLTASLEELGCYFDTFLCAGMVFAKPYFADEAWSKTHYLFRTAQLSRRESKCESDCEYLDLNDTFLIFGNADYKWKINNIYKIGINFNLMLLQVSQLHNKGHI